VPYPLAHARPWFGPGRHFFISAQEQAGLPPELWACVEPQTGVVLLLPPAESFLERVEFDGDEEGVVVRLRPSGPSSQVMIDPEVRFGSPTTCVVRRRSAWCPGRRHDPTRDPLSTQATGHERSATRAHDP
jgi:hypothetical protein